MLGILLDIGPNLVFSYFLVFLCLFQSPGTNWSHRPTENTGAQVPTVPVQKSISTRDLRRNIASDIKVGNRFCVCVQKLHISFWSDESIQTILHSFEAKQVALLYKTLDSTPPPSPEVPDYIAQKEFAMHSISIFDRIFGYLDARRIESLIDFVINKQSKQQYSGHNGGRLTKETKMRPHTAARKNYIQIVS